MINKQQAFEQITNTAKNKITHQDYDHVVNLAKKYKALASGVGIENYLKQFQKRETDVDFKQRCELTIYTTSSIWAGLNKPKMKIASTKPLVNELRYAPDNEANKKLLTSLVDNFYGTNTLNYWLRHVLLQWEDTDPNAWVVITFDDFDARFEKPIAYGVVLKSEDAVDFNFNNNILQYLTVRKDIKYQLVKQKNKSEKGSYYLIYADNDQIDMTQIDNDSLPAAIKPGVLVDESYSVVDVNKTTPKTTYYYRTNEKTAWEVKFYLPKSKRVPAFRIGEIVDKATDGRTRVSLIHSAVPYIEEILKTGSEFDINMSMHAFLQKISYAPPCQGSVIDTVRVSCNDGYTPAGDLCQTCNGTGITVHTTGQDLITLRMPKRQEDAFTLSNLATYISMPTEILDVLDKFIEKCERKSYNTVYNSDTYVQGQITDTATGKIIDKQSEYNAISPIASRYSYAYRFIVEQIAIYNSIDSGLIVAHQFPANFHFESVAELINKLQAAKSAGASELILQQINEEIVALAFEDQPQKKRELEVKSLFNPFDGKSEMMIQTILSNDWTTEYNKTLYLFFKEIFIDAEKENVGFYDMTYDKQKGIITTLVQKYMTQIESEKKPIALPGNEDSQTVDSVKAMFNDGSISEEDAVKKLVDDFSYDAAEASAFLNS